MINGIDNLFTFLKLKEWDQLETYYLYEGPLIPYGTSPENPPVEALKLNGLSELEEISDLIGEGRYIIFGNGMDVVPFSLGGIRENPKEMLFELLGVAMPVLERLFQVAKNNRSKFMGFENLNGHKVWFDRNDVASVEMREDDAVVDFDNVRYSVTRESALAAMGESPEPT